MHRDTSNVYVVSDLLACGIALPTHFDAVLRTGQRAQVAGDAQRFTRYRIVVQARRAAESLGDLRPLLGILLGVIRRGTLI